MSFSFKIVSAYDQEIPQSQTADQPVASAVQETLESELSDLQKNGGKEVFWSPTFRDGAKIII